MNFTAPNRIITIQDLYENLYHVLIKYNLDCGAKKYFQVEEIEHHPFIDYHINIQLYVSMIDRYYTERHKSMYFDYSDSVLKYNDTKLCAYLHEIFIEEISPKLMVTMVRKLKFDYIWYEKDSGSEILYNSFL